MICMQFSNWLVHERGEGGIATSNATCRAAYRISGIIAKLIDDNCVASGQIVWQHQNQPKQSTNNNRDTHTHIHTHIYRVV